jgi:hypothetical protein
MAFVSQIMGCVLDDSLGSGALIRIATRCGLDDQGIESWWGARFSVPVQTGLETHPTTCTMCTGSFPAVKRP